MEGKWCKNFFLAFAISAFVSAPAWAIDHHHDLNGTWMLMLPAGGSGGESATAAGTVTIDDRVGNIYVVQNLTYGDSSGEASSAFTLEGRKGATIREGNLTGKANWKNGVLEVEITQNDVTNVERFSLQPDGAMLLDFERPGRPSVTLLFERE